jgi:hypothetical protein
MRAVAFASWGTTDLPNYTRYHIDQLAPWHDEVHICTNVGRPVDESWVKERGYHIHYFENTGRDYQKYHDFLMKMGREWTCDLESFSMINDSIICYGPLTKFFEWVRSRPEEMVGLNGMKFPLFHVQGSPVEMKHSFLPKMFDHFERTGVVRPIAEIEKYELAWPELTQSLRAMYPQAKRRGWDELFSVPFEDGVPLVKHYCISPRKPFLLRQWQERIKTFAHPDSKPWAYLPLLLDSTYIFRNEA